MIISMSSDGSGIEISGDDRKDKTLGLIKGNPADSANIYI
jgi:hypothetical protein